MRLRSGGGFGLPGPGFAGGFAGGLGGLHFPHASGGGRGSGSGFGPLSSCLICPFGSGGGRGFGFGFGPLRSRTPCPFGSGDGCRSLAQSWACSLPAEASGTPRLYSAPNPSYRQH